MQKSTVNDCFLQILWKCAFWVFLHAEFISAKQTEPKSIGFEKYAKNGIKNIYHYFLFFVNFSKSFKQKLIIPIGSCFLDGKKAQYS